MGNKQESYPIPMFTLKKLKEKLFQRYWVFHPTK